MLQHLMHFGDRYPTLDVPVAWQGFQEQPVPRYFFHSVDGSIERDDEGVELADDQTAQATAMIFAGEVLQSEPEKVWDSGQWRVQVTNEEGELLFTVVTIAIDAPMLKAAF